MQAKSISTFRLDVTIVPATLVLRGTLRVLDEIAHLTSRSVAQSPTHTSMTKSQNEAGGNRKEKRSIPLG
jgi:hypothetical protein